MSAEKYLTRPKICEEIKFLEKLAILLNINHQDIGPKNMPVIMIKISWEVKLLPALVEKIPTKLMIVIGLVKVNTNVVKTSGTKVRLSTEVVSLTIIVFDLISLRAR